MLIYVFKVRPPDSKRSTIHENQGFVKQHIGMAVHPRYIHVNRFCPGSVMKKYYGKDQASGDILMQKIENRIKKGFSTL